MKKNIVLTGGFFAATIAAWFLTEFLDEAAIRMGIGPRQLVPQSLTWSRNIASKNGIASEQGSTNSLETGSIRASRRNNKENDPLTKRAQANCLNEKAKAISEDEARIATIKSEWDKCLSRAKWWPLVVGDAQTYCEPWQRANLAIEAGLASIRTWTCEHK